MRNAKKPDFEPAIIKIFEDSEKLRKQIRKEKSLISQIAELVTVCLDRVQKGGVVYACGNGGSACDAMHLVEELVARYKRERPGIKALHFEDPSTLTCWSNDYSFSSTYERYVQTFCSEKDILIVFSTSGRSENVIRAVRAAKELGTFTVGLIGKDGGHLSKECDLSIIVPSQETERIQEVHITIVHTLCELMEVELLKR